MGISLRLLAKLVLVLPVVALASAGVARAQDTNSTPPAASKHHRTHHTHHTAKAAPAPAQPAN